MSDYARLRRSLPSAIAALALAVAALPATAAARKNPCSLSGGGFGSQTPSPDTAPLAPSVTAMFAFLRREAGPEDAVPLFNPFEEDVGYQLRAFFPAEVRQIARDPDGERYFEIPGFERGYPIPPARCLPRPLRRRRAKLVAEERKRENRLVYCIGELGPMRPAYRQGTCTPFADVQSGAGLIATAESTTEVLELAPDGVASVRLRYRNGALITAPVANNVFDFTPPQGPIKKLHALLRKVERKFRHARPDPHALKSIFNRFERARARLDPQTVEWLAANGQQLRVFHPGGRGSRGLIIGRTIEAG